MAVAKAKLGLRVTSKRDGFRRAGYEWNGSTVIPLADLSKDQVEQLKAESLLVVEEVELAKAESDTDSED